jgi:hypothetical protein
MPQRANQARERLRGAKVAKALPLTIYTAFVSRDTGARNGKVRATMGYVAQSKPEVIVHKSKL